MKNLKPRATLIWFYLSLLFLLFLCVSATPMLIRHGIPLTRDIIFEEETIETVLIVFLFGVFVVILRRFMHTLKTYQHVVNRAGKEKKRLVSRLAEAFNYIGTVNVEMQELESVLHGVDHFPQSKRELKDRIDQLAVKSMIVAAVPWLIVRMIDRHSGQTVFEHAVHRSDRGAPSVTVGNRQILDGQRVGGMQIIGSRQRNLGLATVFIMTDTGVTKDRALLLTAILNQIEMLLMLYRAGCLGPVHPLESTKKEVTHDSNY